MDYKQKIASLIKIDGVSDSEIIQLITVPKDSANGDFCLPCFKFAKIMKKSPMAIADQLATTIEKNDFVESVESVAGYLNFKLNKNKFNSSILTKVLKQGDQYGASDEGNGKVICIDFSSINIAKPFHIGHLSTTVIGASLYRIYSFLGYKVVGINHLGDWGTQFGKLIVAYKMWGNKKDIEERGVSALLEIYVKFHQQAELDDSLNAQARSWFKKIEDNNAEAVEIFQWFKDITLKEVSKTYTRLGIHFDSYAGESFYNDKMQPVIDELQEKGLLHESDGAKVVNLDEFNMPPCLIVKADGATLYATRDLAAAFYRKSEYNFHKALYVVAYQQNLHFKQWFKVIELMGYDWHADLEHIAFGMVSLEDGGAIKTRDGNVVFLEDVLNRTVDKAYEILCEKSASLENKKETAELIGTGAVVFSALYNNRIKDIAFSYDRVLNFDGETGPYVQYTHARCTSVLKRADITDVVDYNAVNNDEGNELIKLISKFPQVIEDACKSNEPCYVSRLVMNVAQAYNKFYFEHRIIDAPEPVRNARLMLTKATKQVIATGLKLIGVVAPEKM